MLQLRRFELLLYPCTISHRSRPLNRRDYDMLRPFSKSHLIASCLAISIVLHFFTAYAVRMFGSYHFGAAVSDPAAVMVDLEGAGAREAAAAKPHPVAEPEAEAEAEGEKAQEPERKEAPPAVATAPPAQEDAEEALSPAPAATPAPPAVVQQQPATTPSVAAAPREEAVPEKPAAEPAAAPQARKEADVGSAGAAGGRGKGVFSAKYEKLSYAISMFGLPIGYAELEAKNDQKVTTITLKVNSSPAAAGIYPVSDYIETQHIDGKYLMTKIRQQEGKFRSDEAFTINLQKKRVFWSDNIHYRNLRLALPTDEVLDTLSGIYSLRNRPLQVGKTEMLHIFDSESYAEVPVEVLRREEVRLPNLTKVAALVVRPLQQTAGIFRRTGEIEIWMTDDADKVPVKIVTTIALGKVTAELVSAESEPHEMAVKEEKR